MTNRTTTKQKLDPETRFDTLILTGGSEKVLAAIGALSRLPLECCWHSCKTIIGTSAGALLGMMISLRIDPNECVELIKEYFSDLQPELSIFSDDDPSSTFGVFDGRQIVGNFVRKILYRQMDRVNCTLREFVQFTGVYLVVPVCNVTESQTEMLCVRTAPDIDMVTAMCMTTCVPFLFRPIPYRDCLYVDGAVYGEMMTRFSDDLTPGQILMIYIEVPPSAPIDNVFGFASNLLQGMLFRRNRDRLEDIVNDRLTTVTIRCDGRFSIVNTLTSRDNNIFKVSDDTVQHLLRIGHESAECVFAFPHTDDPTIETAT